MIALGAALVSQFAWILFIFAAFLIVTGIKMLVVADNPVAFVDNRAMRFVQRHLRVTKEAHGSAFFVRMPATTGGRTLLYATPLFLALVLIELADLVFAVDSVPAIFAITTDPYIVYTSNIFAILGLRALYFALVASVHRFRYLKYALSIVLVFIGAKIFWSQAFGKVDPLISLGVTVLVLASGVAVSMWKTSREGADAPPHVTPIKATKGEP
jgi:tellurite resistance protein TerC